MCRVELQLRSKKNRAASQKGYMEACACYLRHLIVTGAVHHAGAGVVGARCFQSGPVRCQVHAHSHAFWAW